MTSGFNGWRIAGEMTFFKNNLLQELIDFEKACRKAFDIPIIGICVYNINTIIKTANPTNLYKELVKTHGIVLLATTEEKLGKIEIRR